MKWFTNKKRRRLEMAQQGIKPTSKNSLKWQCLYCAKGDLKEARELYDFLAGDLPDLPDFDPVPPTWQQSTLQTVNGVMDWVRDHQDTLAQAYDFIRDIAGRRRGVAAPEAPVAQALPPINE